MVEIKHDLHQHSILSDCCRDPQMTPQTMLEHAVKSGYDTICITDHYWDTLAPGADDWYIPQNTEHVTKSLPLPKAPGVRFCFGCETEYCGGEKIGIAPASYDRFDFIIVPVNHFHMTDFTRPSEITAPGDIARLMMKRLEELQRLPLPWKKVGIAHFTCTTTRLNRSLAEVFDSMPQSRLRDIFRFFAREGTGIELNACAFPANEPKESLYRPYRIALEAGCRVYFGSDAHKKEELEVKSRLEPVAEALNLTESCVYHIPQ
ncbi:MAG: PHP domain-containing protein [Oscillospiraceae bacterium]|nr:PHP domain-containing protein [Oscillospiraceae bacterium]